jgi:KDO2-lipid IV(A) lauroyltransferase
MTTPMHMAGYARAARWARGFARVYPRISPTRFSRAVHNLRDAYPAWSDDEVHRHALHSYEHLFQLAAEFVFIPRLMAHESCMKHLSFTDTSPAVRALLSDRPVILLSGHVGNWELIGYAMSMLGFPMHAIYRPIDLRPLDDWVYAVRKRRGLTLVSKFGAMRVMPGCLEKRQPIGLVADQSGGDRGVFTPFFGRLTSTYKSIGLLAMQSRATIVCGYARRLRGDEAPSPGAWQKSLMEPVELARFTLRDHDLRMSVEVMDCFGPEDWEGQPDPLYYLTARYRRAIEMMVRRAPDQYFWMHRVWRSRPAHERLGKPFPDALKEKLRSLPWMTDADVDAIIDRSARDAKDLSWTRR